MSSPLARAVVGALAADPHACRELRGLLALPLQAEPDRWIGTREAAAYLGMTAAALHKLTAAKEIPFEQDCPGGKLWFKRSELDRWRRGGSVRRSTLRVV